MKTPKDQKPLPAALRSLYRLYQMPTQVSGNTLLYILVLLVIFSVLGTAMVSLFTTSATSSATPNDARRAYYIAESGARYALSRIRDANFYQGFIEEINNTPQYTLDNGSNFTINIFSPWFISTAGQSNPVVNPFTLAVPNEGKIPENFSIPDSNVSLVDWQNFRVGSDTSYSEISSSSTPVDAKSLTITLGDNLNITAGNIAGLAVNCENNIHTIEKMPSNNSYLYIAEEAKDFFPSRYGAIRILKTDDSYYDYYYEKLEHDSAGNRVKLINLSELPGANWTNISVTTLDYVVLSIYNYQVITTGKSGDVTVVLGQDKQPWAFPHTGDWTITQREFIEDVSQKVSDIVSPVAKTELGITEEEDKIILGGSDPGFGDLWYGGDKPIGGDNNFCQNGQCLFENGIRVFFTLDTTSGSGEGFIFTVIAAGDDGTGNPVNTKNSAGGDFESSELLGYAGDSRFNSTPQFLDGSGKGLRPPKIGVEFDTKTQFDQNFGLQCIDFQCNYCSGANLKANTRNDPLPGGSSQDAVQYVFWGSEDPPQTLELSSCRADSPNQETYDDNRHDAESFSVKWTFATAGEVKSSPAVGSDGTIYVGSDDNNLYAINPDDRKRHFEFGDRAFPTANEWQKVTGDNVRSSPLVVESGDETTIYIGSDDNLFYALDQDGNELWNFNVGGDVSLGRPSIGPNGNIYVSNSEDITPFIYALNSVSGVEVWSFDIGDETEYMAGVDPNSGVIYTDRSGNQMIAFDQVGTPRWVLNVNADIRSTPQVGTDGRVYFSTFFNSDVDFDSGEFFAALDSGATSWRYPGNTGGLGGIGTIETTPALSNDQSVVYGVAENERLYAINTADGSVNWDYSPVGVNIAAGEIQSSPTVDPDDDIIYVGSDEDPGGKILAVNPDGTLRWKFSSPLDVNSTPAVDPNSKIVYAGSDDQNLYAVNQIAEPRSYRTEQYEDKKVVSADDFAPISFTDSDNWLAEGPWAIRFEVIRDLVAGEGVYVLKAWVEKCTDGGCSKPLTSLFRNTLVKYDVAAIPPKLEQTIKLSGAEHDKFERFLFGFTSAVAAGDTQESIIKFFELSFIRPTDPVVTSDPNLEG